MLTRLPPNAKRTRDVVRARTNDRRGLQIGPRIRVGGTLGKVGKVASLGLSGGGLTNVGHAIGDAADNKYVKLGTAGLLAATGVGAPAAAAIMAAEGAAGGGLKRGGGLMPAVVGGAKGAVEGYGAAKLGEGVRSIASNGITNTLRNGGSSLLSNAKKVITGGGSDGVGNFGMVGDLAGHLTGGSGDGGGGLADKALLAGAVASAAADRKRQQGLQDKAVNYATSSYDARAPVRAQGQSMALNPNTPELSNIFSDSGNVYDNQKRGVALGPKMPARKLTY